MEISKIMTRKVFTVSPDDTLCHIRNIFQKVTFHHLVVTKGTKLLGVISDRDLLRHLSPNLDSAAETLDDRKCLEMRVSDIMHRKVVAVQESLRISSAVRLMMKKRVSCLPVASPEGHLVGIVTIRGILVYYIENETQSWKDDIRLAVERELEEL